MEIVVRVSVTPAVEVLVRHPGPGQPFLVFSDELELVSIDGHGLPGPPNERRAGTQSGFLTILRDVKAGDPYLPVLGGGAAELIEYQATYKLNAVAGAPPRGLQEGQITARGVFFGAGGTAVGEKRFAITGGTAAYANARGEITEGVGRDAALRTLKLVL